MTHNHDYNFKTDDTRPTVRYAFEEIHPNDGQNLNDIEVIGATFTMQHVGTDEVVVDDATATIVDEQTGVLEGTVEYQLSASETKKAGVYVAEFELEYRDGSTRHVPQNENITIKVTESI